MTMHTKQTHLWRLTIIFGMVLMMMPSVLQAEIKDEPPIQEQRQEPTVSANPESFISVWDTTKTSSGSSDSHHIELPLEPTGIYSFTIDWGDNFKDTITSYSGTVDHYYFSTGVYFINITGVLIGWRFNNGGDRLKICEIRQWGSLRLGNSGSYFYGCTNLQIMASDKLNLTGTTSLYQAFRGCTNLGSLVNFLDTSSVTNMGSLFYGVSSFNGFIHDWDTSSVNDMSYLFYGASSFNRSISGWDTSSVTNMARMFSGALNFNQNISGWDTSKVTDMSGMFGGVTNFNYDIGGWNTSNVTNMASMFSTAYNFNQDIGGWNTSSVTNMASMFLGARYFNQDIGGWDTSKVTDMSNMFKEARAFDQNIGGWNTSSVINMNFMFSTSECFNQDISGWNTSIVTSMAGMFRNAFVFNQPIGGWNTSCVTNMESMFYMASKFDQDISSWDISIVEDMSSMFENAELSTFNYDRILKNWAQLPVQPFVIFHAGNSKYSSDLEVEQARLYLINNMDWEISDGGNVPCINIISPVFGEILLENPPNFEVEVYDKNLAMMWLTIDGGQNNYTFNTNDTINETAWAAAASEVDIVVTFYANNSLGNIACDEVIIQKDILAPRITILFPEEEGSFEDNSPNFEIAIHERNMVDAMWYTLDGGLSNVTFTANGTLDAALWAEIPNNAEILLTFYANDSLGNLGTSQITISKKILPSAPVLHALSTPNDNGTVVLSWDPVPYATQYYIYRSVSAIDSVAGRSPLEIVIGTTFTDRNLPNGTYFYVIVAANDVGDSPMSNTESVVVAIPPPAEAEEQTNWAREVGIWVLSGVVSTSVGIVIKKAVSKRERLKDQKKLDQSLKGLDDQFVQWHDAESSKDGKRD